MTIADMKYAGKARMDDKILIMFLEWASLPRIP